MNIPTKPANATWTDAQWKAIYAHGSDLLVSAAAGSGKTAVLIERLIQKIIREDEPIDVDQLLVVTFTNAAAAEMRHRMANALEAALAKNPTSNHLRKQLTLVNKAQISTLHSFCLAIVRQYAYTIDLDPGFRLANEAETALLKDDAIQQLLEKAYTAENPESMYRLADSFSSDRDDQAIETLIDRLYNYSRVHPNPTEWLNQIPLQYDILDEARVDDLPFIHIVKQSIEYTIEEAIAMADEVIRFARLPDGPAPLGETVDQDKLVLHEALRRVRTESWERIAEYFNELKFVKAATIKKDTCDPDLAERAKNKRNALKKRMTDLASIYFSRSSKRLLDEMRAMYPQMVTLVDLTKQFAELYRAEKSERGILDFSDLEHLALSILSHEENGEVIPSDVALELMNRFDEVLVDEYQDVNLLQESIIQIIKKGTEATGNLFMVGDVKQSIYRFRLAEPMLFLGKYQQFNEEPQNSGMKIDLNANFRSRKEVLHTTNDVFSQIMGTRVGEIEYDEAASLKPGAPYSTSKASTELVLLTDPQEIEDDAADDENEEIRELEDLKKSQWEARYIIRKIRQLMQSGQMVEDPWTKAKRPLEYRDIVILMRSMTWTEDFTEEFKQAGIPLYAEVKKGYFDALEVMIMLDTLRTVDNPYQDIPLAAVLRAPFIGLTDSELARIRTFAPKVPFYDAVIQFVDSGQAGIHPETAEKLQRFLTQFEDWRNLARRGSLPELIWRIYLDTHYYEMVGAMPNGKQRQANLRALHDRALSYEQTSFRGLFRFLRFIDRMKKRGDDLGAAKAISERENVVRLMTIHASKGLEFPLVFLSGLGRPFNKMEFHQSYLFDQNFGLAVKAIDPDLRVSYTSLPYLAMKEQKQLELIAEEMRVLYVAMTRAREKLILLAAISEVDKQANNWHDAQLASNEQLPEYIRANAKRYIDWIGPAVSRFVDVTQLTFEQPLLDETNRWQVEVVDTTDFLNMHEQNEELHVEENRVGDQNDYEAFVKMRFDTMYPFDEATRKRSKQTVSELKRLDQLRRMEEPEFFRPAQVERAMEVVVSRPQFMQGETRQLSPAERGTAVHTAMQHVPFDLPATMEAVDAFIQTLVERQLLTEAEGQAIDRQGVIGFLQSELGERLRQAQRIYREMPFTYAISDEMGDRQILQGIVDCLFEDAQGSWVLVDYKTDFTRGLFPKEEGLRREMNHRYGMQLSIYEQAVQSILNVNVKEKWLYLFQEQKMLLLEEE